MATVEKDIEMIPILLNHNSNHIIGKAFIKGNRLIVEFSPSFIVTKESLFNIFGNAGLNVLEVVDDRIIKIEILEFSLP
jgi:hypothetical protein